MAAGRGAGVARAGLSFVRVVFRCDPALRGLLPPPIAAREALPDWLRTMPREVASAMHEGAVRTVKQCPPFVDAMMHGFIVPLPCDVHVGAGKLSWDWDLPELAAAHHPRAPVSFHAPGQTEGSPFHRPGQVVVKFNSFWTIAVEPGWSVFVMHPVNREDLPFRTLSGLVDGDRFHDVGLLFPAVWNDPGFEGVLPRGMPVAQCFPVPRAPLELVQKVLDPAAYDGVAGALLGAPGVYRKRFRARRSDAGGEFSLEGGGVEPETSDAGGDQGLGDAAE